MNASAWLPTTVKEMKALGWDSVDVVLFSGDAYVDHPAFGAAVIGRTLEAKGFKVAIVPQPNWQDDLRDFKKFGRPRLFFGLTAGAMDSMVNHYTANRRRRSDDAYTPDGRHGARPDYPTIVYSRCIRKCFPDCPIVAGGIEASMRRLSHYDYWQDRLLHSILLDAPIDLLVYGMGEKTIAEIARRLDAGDPISSITDIPQTAYISAEQKPVKEGDILLNSYDDCLRDKKCQAENFRHIEEESNSWHGKRIVQLHGDKAVVVNPMYPPLSTEEVDKAFDLPYTRLPHPRYKGKHIPAFEMIKFSVCMHRGCFGGCAFCTISAHQGKHIASRSKKSILAEVEKITQMPDFKGYISDLGGPSANMFGMHGKDLSLCMKCKRPSCLTPRQCRNLNSDHSQLLDIYKSVDSIPCVKKSFVGSGVRYDLAMNPTGDESVDATNRHYLEELIINHVSGRLKVAPEHTADRVLEIMRKPSFEMFHHFKAFFDNLNSRHNLRQQLIPYFISSHPGCREIDMAELAVETKKMNFRLEQVQDFTPTPMTLATEIYYTGYHPYTMERVFTATSKDDKLAQRRFFFWYEPSQRQDIIRSLRRLHRPDLIDELIGHSGSTMRKKPRR
ncbi:MAG: YgiQ family radical SAM protein [Muribaculaceae bacterium]|nr:YgiQ family radical SAM protein [Muribaculaceae bacterium]